MASVHCSRLPRSRIEGEHYWDGVLFPHAAAVGGRERSGRDTLAFQVDLWTHVADFAHDV